MKILMRRVVFLALFSAVNCYAMQRHQALVAAHQQQAIVAAQSAQSAAASHRRWQEIREEMTRNALTPRVYYDTSGYDAEAVERIRQASRERDKIRRQAQAVLSIAEEYYYGLRGRERNYEKARLHFELFVERFGSYEYISLAWAYEVLGTLHAYAIGTKKDYKKAIELYRLSIEHTPCEAIAALSQRQINLAGVYFILTDYREAFSLYETVADQNENRSASTLSLLKLGQMYYYGQGTQQDCASAYSCFEEAASDATADGYMARANLAFMLYLGVGVTRNTKAALAHCEKIVQKKSNGNAISLAQAILRDKQFRNVHKGPVVSPFNRELWNRACDDALAGHVCYAGYIGEKEYDVASQHLRRAIEQDVNPYAKAHAQYMLADLLYRVEKNYGQAEALLQLALMQETNVPVKILARVMLAELYIVSRNESKYREAYDLLQFAANQMEISSARSAALGLLGELSHKGLGVLRNLPQAVSYFLAAGKDNPFAHVMLGEAYFFGQGTEKNYGAAFRCFVAVSKQDSNLWAKALAHVRLGEMYELALCVERSFEQARVHYGYAVDQDVNPEAKALAEKFMQELDSSCVIQ